MSLTNFPSIFKTVVAKEILSMWHGEVFSKFLCDSHQLPFSLSLSLSLSISTAGASRTVNDA